MATAQNLFKATSKTVTELLIENGEFFYVPAYQRQYNWDKLAVLRLVENVVQGMLDILNDPDSFTFLGSIILIEDREHKAIAPIHKVDVPAQVSLVIDGQQRLTTIILFVIALHERLRDSYERIKSIKPDQKTALHDYLDTATGETLNQIHKLLIEHRFNGAGNPTVPYVKLIRAYEDAWSRKTDELAYDSPIAGVIYDYAIKNLGFDLDQKRSKFSPRKYHNDSDKSTCGERFKEIKNLLKNLLNDEGIGEELLKIPSSKLLLRKENIRRQLFPDMDSSIKELLTSETCNQEDSIAFGYLTLTRFLIDRVAITVVDVDKEEYAFSVFDTLNTTGQLLAPMETFTPLVMKSVGIENYRGSPEKVIIDDIYSVLGDLDKKNNRNNALESAIIFAQTENGHRLGKDVTDQRNFLRVSYRRVEEDLQDRLAYLEHLRTVVQLKKSIFGDWENPTLPGFQIHDLDHEVVACLGFLAKLNHTVVLPLLTRFWIQVKTSSSEDDKAIALDDFQKCVKAITAFTVLYRSVSTDGKTDGIDEVYREIMSGINSPTSLEALHRSSLAHHGEEIDIAHPLKVDDVIKDLSRRIIDSPAAAEKRSKNRGVTNRETYVSKAAGVAIYKSQTLARFMVLVAMHDSVPDSNNHGLLVKGLAGSNKTLDLATWKKEETNTVEHIAPQNPREASGWDTDIYSPDNLNLVDRIGNLTLCPKGVNSTLGNAGFARKRIAYAALGQKEFKKAQSDLLAANPPFTDLAKKVREMQAGHLPFFGNIGQKTDDWDAAFIKVRTENMLGFVWDKLTQWLAIPSSS